VYFSGNTHASKKYDMSRSNPDINKFISLQNLSILYEFKFDPIKDYLNQTQELILGVEQDVSEKIKKWDSEQHDDPETPNGFAVYESEVMATGEFRPLLYRSMFITIYGFFEHEFKTLCGYAGGISGTKLRPNDLSGNNYIDQCRRFVSKVLNVNLDNLQNDWAEITKFQLLRNSFAHNNGILKDTNKNNIDFIHKTDGLSIDEETYEIFIETNEFLIILINKLVKFLDKTIEEIIRQKE